MDKAPVSSARYPLMHSSRRPGGQRLADINLVKYRWLILPAFVLVAFGLVLTRFGSLLLDDFNLLPRVLCVWTVAAGCIIAHVRYLSRLPDRQFLPKFGMRVLLLSLTAVAVLSAIGYAVDVIFFAMFLACTFLVGPAVYKVLSHRVAGSGNASVTLARVSACVIVTFVVLATIASLGVVAIDSQLMYWRSEFVELLLFISAAIGYFAFLGDNAQSEWELLRYGLPFGLPINILLGVSLGVVLGRIAAWRCRKTADAR